METHGRIAGWLLALALAGTGGCSSTDYSGGSIIGEGPLVEENRPVSGFNAVIFETSGILRIEQGEVEELRIRVQENLISLIETEVLGEVLHIGMEGGQNLIPTRQSEFYLTVISLESVVLADVGDIEASDLETDHLSLTLSGIGDMRFTGLDAGELTVEINGIGNVTASGEVQEQSITIRSLATYDAGDLSSVEAEALIVGSGSATVRVSDRLVVTIEGSGWLGYYGDPDLELSVPDDESVEHLSD